MYFKFLKRKTLTTGPEINTKEEAMKTLGIEKEFPGSEDSGVSIKVDLFITKKYDEYFLKIPLSKYTERDILEAFRKKLKNSAAKSSAQVILHESYQVDIVSQNIKIT